MKKKLLFFSLFVTTFMVAQVSFTTQSINTTGQYTYCAVDMNGDYLDDIVSVSATNLNIHFQNTDGTFTAQDFPTTPADYMPSWSIAAGDITANGFNDLIYGGTNGVTFMYNSGTSYAEVSGPEFVFSQRTNFVDINNDGHLDAFVCHDLSPNVYYLNDGNGNLVFNQGGLGDVPVGGNYASLWVDYNNDGHVDLFIAKCSGGGQGATAKYNELHRNNGDGTFTDVSAASGLYDPIQTWSAAWGDFDNDGFMDVLVGAESFSDGGHKLMRNNGDGTFTDVTPGSGFDVFTDTSIEHATYDFNNDGYLDIFGNSNTMFINNGDFTFTPVTVPFSGAAIGDFDNDGFLDAVRGGNIYYNDGNANNWITINTQGVQSNRNGIGARIELYSDMGTQIRDVRSGEGFRYMSTLNTHIGIGTDTSIDKVIIRWPSGIVDTIDDPAINSTLHILEGDYYMGIEDQAPVSLALFPNPTSEMLHIHTSQSLNGSSYSIYDVAGRTIRKSVLDINTINVTTLAAGVYFLDIIIDGQSHKHRFIKN